MSSLRNYFAIILWAFLSLSYCEETTNQRTIFSINLLGNELYVYPHEYLLNWASACGSLTENWKDFYDVFLKEGDYIVDVNSGFGWSFIHQAKLVGSTGMVIGVHKDPANYDILRSNIDLHKYWNQTLIAHSQFYQDFNAGETIMPGVFSYLHGHCPKLISFRKLLPSEPNPMEVLADSTDVLYRCFPVIYVDTNELDVISSIVHALSMSNYKFYLQKLNCYCTNKDVFKDRVGLIGIVDNHVTEELRVFLDQSTVPIATPIEAKYRARHICEDATYHHDDKQYRIGASTSKEVAVNQVSILPWAEEEQTHYHSLETITIDLDILVDPYSPLRCFWKYINVVEESLALELYIDQSIVNGTYRAMATLQCTSWINTLIHTSIARYLGTNTDYLTTCGLHNYENLFYHGSLVSQNCKDFVLRRLELDLHMYLRRRETTSEQVVGNLTFPTTNTTTNSNAQSAARSDSNNNQTYQIAYHNYDLSTLSTSDQFASWFTRPVFESLYDAEGCGEPIWCAMMEEFQSRLYHWQHPPRYLHDPEYPSFPSFASFPDHIRTCENAKFLVYEPSSNLHGIGSFLELIASALRLAICLDRILILQIKSQAGTMLKWRHAGCVGNTIECYFQPISNCIVPEEELIGQKIYPTAEVFHTYPFRSKKVLMLTGLPEAKVCSLCDSRWPRDSIFFEGLYIVDNPFEPSFFTNKKITQASSFLEAIRLPYLAQNLRYLLRPRKWLQETIQRIVTQTMTGPILSLATTNNDTITAFNASYLLDPTTFPASSFLSLHVRWGMKYVEVELESLQRYMTFIRKKFPGVKDIFLSTETPWLLEKITREYPEYRFYSLRYNRSEYLFLHADVKEISQVNNPFVMEFLFSMANLFVATEAQGFVGTLSSNWCMMIHHLERTRGDGGYDYYSMDRGSAFTTCF